MQISLIVQFSKKTDQGTLAKDSIIFPPLAPSPFILQQAQNMLSNFINNYIKQGEDLISVGGFNTADYNDKAGEFFPDISKSFLEGYNELIK